MNFTPLIVMPFRCSSILSWPMSAPESNKLNSLATQSLAGSASQDSVPSDGMSSSTPRWQKLTPSALPQSAMSNLTLIFCSAGTLASCASSAALDAGKSFATWFVLQSIR